MAFSAGGGSGLRAEMNVTPMIDVLLVLIIIFMMITPLVPLAPTGEEALIPQPSPDDAKAPPPDKVIVVQVMSAPEGQRPVVKINQQEVPWDEIEPTLREIFVRRAEKVAFVKADRELDFEYVALVIGIAHDAGVVRIGLMSEARKS
jgi:biopolymer transport protein TolR